MVCNAVHAQNNSWIGTSSSGKWETNTNWSAGAPTDTHSCFITNGPFNKTVTVDAITAGTTTMTVSNLTLAAIVSPVNTLFLNNAGTGTPLRVRDTFNVLSSGLLLITNSALSVERFFRVGGNVFLRSGSIVTTTAQTELGCGDGVGQLTVSNGSWTAGIVFVGPCGGSLKPGALNLAGGTNLFTQGLFIAYNGATATGTVWVTGGMHTVSNQSTIIGWEGSGRLTVSNGTFNAFRATIAQDPGSAGTLTVAGGTFTAERLVATNSISRIEFPAGTMTLSDAEIGSSAAFQIGEAGKSAVLNLVGGTNRFYFGLSVGPTVNSTGTVWMTGGQLVLTNASTYIGATGIGQMTVSNGTWQAQEVIVGLSPFGNGTLRLAGGTNTFSGRLVMWDDPLVTGAAVWMTGGVLTTTNKETIIGELGPAQMTVSNGTWRARHVIVGNSPGAQGALTVAGGTSSVYSNLTIGNFGCSATGIVNVTGGQLRVTNNAATAVLEVRSGTLTQSGGTLDIDRLIITNDCGRFIHTGGTLIIGLTTLNPFGDADGDGIRNDWEQAAGLDPFDPNDAGQDPDGDGLTNLQEYFTDTNPHDATKFLHITSIVRTNNDIRITWPTEEFYGLGIFYRVLWGTNLLTGITNNLSSNIFGFGTVSTNYLDVGGATNSPRRFYRVLGNID